MVAPRRIENGLKPFRNGQAVQGAICTIGACVQPLFVVCSCPAGPVPEHCHGQGAGHGHTCAGSHFPHQSIICCAVCQALISAQQRYQRLEAPNMPTEQLYSPQDAAQLVGISPSYLRSLAGQWSAHLSDYATPSAGDPRTRRRLYTAQDVATLSAILDLQRRGVDETDIPAQLAIEPPEAQPAAQDQPEPPQAPDSASRALMAFSGALVQDQAARLAALEAQVADLRVQVATLTAQLEALAAAEHDHPAIVPTRRPRR